MPHYFQHHILLLFLVATVFNSCSKEVPQIITNPPSTERGYLVSYTKTGSMTSDKVISNVANLGDVANYAAYDLDIYSIIYNSLDHEETLEVSGLVFVPKDVDGEIAIFQHHHGTIIPGDDGEIPSTYTGGRRGSSEMYFIGATAAANGYVVSMPDYVGYGATGDREHPYTVHHELAEVSVDMIRATQQLLEILSLDFSDDVFLTGWSEGGGAALRTHEYLQEKYTGEFEVKASSLFAGPYDYAGFVKHLMGERDKEDEELSIYSWSMYA
ncbi:MAG: lipase family protein, partial [Bacteroidota bacterium]